MKKLALLLLFAASFCGVHAQVVNPGVTYVTATPSGACGTYSGIQVVYSTGTAYTCSNGTWAAISGGGGGTVTGVTGTSPIVSSGGTTPAISCATCGVTGSNLSQFASGGAINPASTGATTPGTGAYTTLTSSGTDTFNGTVLFGGGTAGTSITANVTYAGGQNGASASTAGAATLAGGSNTSTGQGGAAVVQAGSNSGGGLQGAAYILQSFTTATALAAGNEVVSPTTTTNQVQAAALGSTNVVGVAQGLGGTNAQVYVATVGIFGVLFDGGTSPTSGDFACAPPASGGTAGKAHDNGAVACPSGQALGIVVANVSSTFGLVSLGIGPPVSLSSIQQSTAAVVASATTIAPTTPLVEISGTTAIATITLPSGFTSGCFDILPTGTWTTTTAGNIFNAVTAVADVSYRACYWPAISKWVLK